MIGTLGEMEKLRQEANKPDFDQLAFADQMINLISNMPSETTTVHSKFISSLCLLSIEIICL